MTPSAEGLMVIDQHRAHGIKMCIRDSIDALVEKYRRDLVIFEYRKRLLNERVTKSFEEQEMLDYYERNSEMFRLHEAILKGLFLKVPENTPNLGQLKKLKEKRALSREIIIAHSSNGVKGRKKRQF